MEKKLKNAGRRFRATEQKTEEDSVTAEYLRQKAELENQAGSKDGSNWLVR